MFQILVLKEKNFKMTLGNIFIFIIILLLFVLFLANILNHLVEKWAKYIRRGTFQQKYVKYKEIK